MVFDQLVQTPSKLILLNVLRPSNKCENNREVLFEFVMYISAMVCKNGGRYLTITSQASSMSVRFTSDGWECLLYKPHRQGICILLYNIMCPNVGYVEGTGEASSLAV